MNFWFYNWIFERFSHVYLFHKHTFSFYNVIHPVVIYKIKWPKMSLNPNHGINSRAFSELILFQFRFSGENSASERIDNFEFLTIKVCPDSLNIWDGITNLCWWYLQEVVILHSIANLNRSVQNWINVCNWHNVRKGCYFLFHPIHDQFSLWGIPV